MQHSLTQLAEKPRRKTSGVLTKDAEPRLVVPSEVFLGYKLWRVHHLWHRYFERQLKPLGLTRTQYMLLVATYHLICQGEAPSQIRLSNFTLVEKMMVSKTLRVLEQRGYLSRKPTPGNRRANRIQLTAKGAQLLQRAFAVSINAHAKFFHVLGDERKRIDNLLGNLISSNPG
jgi:DNA-binding MarR family transcriptional regulator